VDATIDDLDPDMLRQLLRIRSGKALAVSVASQLHRLSGT
jgi:hypothetical protein